MFVILINFNHKNYKLNKNKLKIVPFILTGLISKTKQIHNENFFIKIITGFIYEIH